MYGYLLVQVYDYHKKAQRNPTNLKLSDIALSAVIQRVTTTVSAPLLANVLVRLCALVVVNVLDICVLLLVHVCAFTSL